MGLPDEDLVNPDAVSSGMRCIICTEVFVDPVFWGGRPCQHVFCRPCISQSLRLRSDCPTCRAPLPANALQPHYAIRDFLDEVDVRCPKSCGWTGQQRARPAHLAACPVVELEAKQLTIDECNAKIADLQSNLGTCQSTIETLRSKVADQDAELEGYRSKFDSLKDQIAVLEQQLNARKASTEDEDANSAREAEIQQLEARQAEQANMITMQSKLIRLYEEKLEQERAQKADKLQDKDIQKEPEKPLHPKLEAMSDRSDRSPVLARLSTSLLKVVPEPIGKQMLGEVIFPCISKYQLQAPWAAKVTGMMLELDNAELVALLESEAKMKTKVDEAVNVLAQWPGKCPHTRISFKTP